MPDSFQLQNYWGVMGGRGPPAPRVVTPLILGVTIDNKITFYNHIKGLCENTSHKILTL